MAKDLVLSRELSKVRALAAGGVATAELIPLLKAHLVRGSKIEIAIEEWLLRTIEAFQSSVELGGSVTPLLRQIYPLVRKEEKLINQRRVYEQQFAFQAAVVAVIPWGVASLVGQISYNVFFVFGLIAQAFGLFFLVLLFRALKKTKLDERAWLGNLLSNTWIKTLSGQSFAPALAESLAAAPEHFVKRYWIMWLRYRREEIENASIKTNLFSWPLEFQLSADLSRSMGQFLSSGAPVAATLEDWVEQIFDEKQQEQEKQIALAPTRLALGFCLFFAPALFLILFGALWPTFKDLV